MQILLALVLAAIGVPLLGLGLLLVHVGVAALLGPEIGLASALVALVYCIIRIWLLLEQPPSL